MSTVSPSKKYVVSLVTADRVGQDSACLLLISANETNSKQDRLKPVLLKAAGAKVHLEQVLEPILDPRWGNSAMEQSSRVRFGGLRDSSI